MNRPSMTVPLILFGLVFLVIVTEIFNRSGPEGNAQIPIWVVVVGAISLFVSMVGSLVWFAYRSKRDDSDADGP